MPDELQINPDQAAAALEQRVTIPAFFAKLASYGVQPATQQDAQALWDIGNNLKQREQMEAVKQARASGNFYQKLAHELTGQTTPSGFPEPDPRYVAQVTQGYMQDPLLVKSAVVLQDAALAAMNRANAS